MKKRRFLAQRAFSIMIMLALAVLSFASTADQSYKITFSARGEAQTVERVLVQNLSIQESVELLGTDTLLLTSNDELLGIENVTPLKASELHLQLANGKLLVNGSLATDLVVTIHTLSGSQAYQSRSPVTAGLVQLTLPPLRQGAYIISVSAGGQHKSIKWICGNSINQTLDNNICNSFLSQETTEDVLNLPASSEELTGVASNSRLLSLRYKEGDILRFVGTSGKMTTIMTLSPRSSHPVYFDFYKCEDADGNNYAIVNAGGLMWMAEDLRATNVSGVKSVQDLEQWGNNSNDKSAKIYTGGDGVYYSREAALKALPDGWNLPTQGEIDYWVKKTVGSYSTAGKALKSRDGEWSSSVDGIDNYSVGLTPNGYIRNGELQETGKAVLLTRSTKDLKPTAFIVSDDSDELTINNGYGIDNLAFHVRGVRSAPSAYSTMLKKFGTTPQTVAPEKSGEIDYGPLGKTYTLLAGKQSIAFDYSGGQLNDAGMEKRSGILTLYDFQRAGLSEEKFTNDGFIEQDNKNTLRKMAAMTVNGRQYIIEAKFKCPFQLWTRVDENGNVICTDNHDEIGLASLANDAYDEVVELEIYGDSLLDYKLIKKFTVQGLTFDATAFYDYFPYFLYGGRTTEARFDFATRYFQLLTADFTRDGIDDIVVSVDGKMTILDGDIVLNGEYDNAYWNKYNRGAVIANDILKKSNDGYYKNTNVARLAVGDVNNDNYPELVVFRSRNDPYTKSYLDLIAVDIYQNQGELCLYYDYYLSHRYMHWTLSEKEYGTKTNTWFLDVKVGNVTNGKYPDVVMLYRDYNDKSYAQYATLAVCQYNPDAGYFDEKFKQVSVDGGKVSGGFRSNAGCAGNCNVTLLRTENGLSSKREIIVGADLWSWDANAGKVKFKQQVFDWIDNGNYSIFADNIVIANLLGTSDVEAVYYFASMSTSDNAGKRYMYSFLGANIMAYQDSGNLINWSAWNYNSNLFKYNTHGNQWKTNKECELMWWMGSSNVEWGNNPALCAVNINAKSKILEYKSTQKVFGEPTIYAMIAAPPTYLYGENEKSPSEDYVTSWGYSRSTATETSKSSSISASIIAGFEYEFNVPLIGQKVGGIDFTTKLQSEFSKSVSSGSSVTYSQTYEARDDNRVVMQVTPYTLYTYTITYAENPDEIGGEYHVAIPGKPKPIGLGLADYNVLVADAPGAPYLGDVFKHTIGDPFSYLKPGDCPGWNTMWGDGKEDSYVTTGSGGATTREISIENSSEESSGFSFSNETELVVSAGCVKAGVGFGYNRSNQVSHSETKGFAVSASVPGLVVGDSNPDRTFFDWNLCWYCYRAGGQTFPVVNYVVKPFGYE